MMKSIHRLIASAACAALFIPVARPLRAQTTDSTRMRPGAAMDSAFARARQLVISGRAADGRKIVDSVLAATPEGTPAYGAALYGQAMVAPTAADAQRAYERIIVEYPLSPHAGDALLQLAQLERSQGDRAAAITHLQRFLRENPESARRAQTGFWLAQLLFEQNDDDAHACKALDDARAATPASNVELLNQMNFYSTRCDAVAARAHADSVARADSIRADSEARAAAARKSAERAQSRERPKESARKAPAPARARTPAPREGYSVQVGAFATRAEAQKAVARLHDRGIEARIDGAAKPFRVRIGHFKTRTEASEALARYKKLGISGFVTTNGGR